MKKKLFYLGLILIIAALVAFFFAVPALAVPSQLTNFTVKSIAIVGGSSASIPVFLNSSGIVAVEYNVTDSQRVSFYLADASAFGAISNASRQNMSAEQVAASLEGNGVYELYALSVNGIYPYYANYSSAVSAPDYMANVTTMRSGYYYAGFYNPSNITATIKVSAEPITLTQLESTNSSISDGMLATGILFVIGIALIVFAVFSKPKQQPAQGGGLNAEVAKAYDQIEKRGADGGK